MNRRRPRTQSMKETRDTVAKSESEDCSQTENGESVRRFGREAERVPRVEGARRVKREVSIKKVVPEFSSVPEEISVLLVSKRG